MESTKGYLDQDFEKIKYQCLLNQKLFVDDKFPANNSSLFKLIKRPNISWKRPFEISHNPKFTTSDFNSNDIENEENCSFITSVRAVFAWPKHLSKVVPVNQSFDKPSYAGVFHFRFWRYGKWIDVVVDDFLPVDASGNLIFARNNRQKNEFLICLLEKAYAKLNDCYEFLYSDSDSVDSIIDLTGGVHESFLIQSFNNLELWEQLFKSLQLKSLVITLVINEKNKKNSKSSNGNLLENHPYVLAEAIEIFKNDKIRENFSAPSESQSIKLLKMHSPSDDGSGQWNKDWSLTSSKWNSLSEANKKKLLPPNKTVDFFFISFEDYCKSFQRVHFIHVDLEVYAKIDKFDVKSKWLSSEFEGAWVKGVNSGGSDVKKKKIYWSNPQYPLNLMKENKQFNGFTPVIIFLIQTEQLRLKLQRKKINEAIGFKLYKINTNATELQKSYTEDQLTEVGSSGFHIEARQICQKFLLPVGKYIIIPSLFKKDKQMKFVLKIYQVENLYRETEELIDELDTILGFNKKYPKLEAKRLPKLQTSNRNLDKKSNYWQEIDI